MQLRTPVAGRAFAAHSRPNASGRSAAGDASAAVARSRDQISAPSAGPSRRRYPARVRASNSLDIAVAQGEANIEPDRVLDDLGREAMTAVAERSHPDILQDTPLFRLGFR